MRTKLKSLLVTTLLATAATLPGAAFAQTSSTWNLGSSACGTGGGTTYATLTCTGSATGETATMTASGNSGSGTTFVAGTLANWDPSGFGAYVGTDTGSPYHAFDSSNPAGSTEVMMISFGPKKVSLSSVAIGWWSGDADYSVLRWDGAGAPPATGFTTAGLPGLGWTLVGSQDMTSSTSIDNVNDGGSTGIADSGLSARRSTINLGNQVSSYWMISTYYGTTTTSLDSGNDAFKLLNFTASVCTSGTYTGGNGGNGGTCQVSEPGSLALAGVAFFGVAALRRRRARLVPSAT